MADKTKTTLGSSSPAHDDDSCSACRPVVGKEVGEVNQQLTTAKTGRSRWKPGNGRTNDGGTGAMVGREAETVDGHEPRGS
ncbi:50S ribosomal protein L25/l23 [Anopheles sinensis]|uniref:50S ribosomal protein L25/l23 n=1 Tax=Anopheles sinensis TaxID=74873 RepID=A0A084WLG4_ANOSI|nr:50S ribosomal protein L25/l23 [Anopheles sinensis]